MILPGHTTISHSSSFCTSTTTGLRSSKKEHNIIPVGRRGIRGGGRRSTRKEEEQRKELIWGLLLVPRCGDIKQRWSWWRERKSEGEESAQDPRTTRDRREKSGVRKPINLPEDRVLGTAVEWLTGWSTLELIYDFLFDSPSLLTCFLNSALALHTYSPFGQRRL